MDMSLSELRELLMDREAWRFGIHAVLPVTLGAGGERWTQAEAPGLAQAWLCTDSA